MEQGMKFTGISDSIIEGTGGPGEVTVCTRSSCLSVVVTLAVMRVVMLRVHVSCRIIDVPQCLY